MWSFLTAEANLPFSLALGLMLFIGILETASLMLGGGLSSAVDGMLPDIDIDVPEIDFDAPEIDTPSLDAPGSLATMLSWLNVGRVPFLVLLVVFLLAFGAIGLTLQGVTVKTFGFLWPGWLATIPVFVVSLPVTRVSGIVVAKVMPKDETSAVSQDSLIGHVAVIVLGSAQRNSPAQGKTRDGFGQDHYLMIEPDNDDEVFEAGQSVLLVRRAGGTYFAIGNVSESLTG